MRCPKCNFVSFDLLESCVKCGKNISEAATELEGTVVAVAAPSFLKVAGEGTAEFDSEESLDLGAEGEEESMDFSFDDEPSVEASSEDIEMDLGEVADTEEADVEIDLGAEDTPEMDLEADDDEVIGISDLAPAEEELEVAAEEVEEELETVGASQGLGDLQVDGIDLESTPGVDDPGKVVPSVKTGTALDDFDFDLGDLMPSDKD
jgi:hypothetical protein